MFVRGVPVESHRTLNVKTATVEDMTLSVASEQFHAMGVTLVVVIQH